ncbi:MAG TPA: sulfur carrier protein ThiS [Taishania sp.]|nr:sulfur carrier protein ThiS [Taishania sp.]
MKLTINNQEKQYEQSELTIQQLLDLEIPNAQHGVAIAVNERIVPKTNWTSTHIEDCAEILIIKATQGG